MPQWFQFHPTASLVPRPNFLACSLWPCRKIGSGPVNVQWSVTVDVKYKPWCPKSPSWPSVLANLLL